MRLWNTTTGRNTLVNYGRISNDARKSVKFCVINGSHTDLVYVPEVSNIKVFDMVHGNRIGILRGHYTQVNCCKMHEDYQELYSGGNDRNILVWTPEMDPAYEEHLRTIKKPGEDHEERTTSFVRRTAATADTWSSDEDSWPLINYQLQHVAYRIK